MFSKEITKRLEKDLDPKLVLQRYDGLDYIPGIISIQNANAIFGEGNWGYKIKDIKRDGMFIHAIVKVRVYKDDNHNCYVEKEDLGTGKIEMTKEKKNEKTGEIYKESEEIQEMAYKGAVTDGLKRALRSFGKQFGLGLYDEQDQLQYVVRELTDAQREQIKPIIDKMQICKSIKELEKIGKEIADQSQTMDKPQVVYLREIYKATETDLVLEEQKKKTEKELKEIEAKKEVKK